MPTIVSRNTIKLAPSASAVTDYYKNYNITVTRFDSVTGKKIDQIKKIIAYNGTLKIATIDGIWDNDFIPASTDTYKITPIYPDSRVSTNFAMMTLDYITSVRYGKGLNSHKDLDLNSWLQSARICDTQSDVTIKFTSAVTAGIGDVYKFVNSSILHWQGTVKENKNGSYIKFTNILGKLTHKWNSWKVFKAGSIIYEGDRVYKATTSRVYTTKPTHTTGTTDGLEFISAITLTKVSGTGPSTLSAVASTNPVQDLNSKGIKISGYSLYDSDGIDYWRYVGWDSHDQRFVTRHQGNLIVDTSVPLFDNINNLLEHFGGILRYSGGKYSLDIEEAEGDIENSDSEVRNITSADTIGRIRLNDEGLRSSFNSLTVAYADPANKFEAKNISFFNSEFLKADRNVPKKGNVSIPGITNYYNARLLADKFLVKSRYGLTISFNMSPRGILLASGAVIQIQNDRYGWTDKKFRIENITHNNDCTVDIVAKEYDDKFYVISNVSKPPAVGNAGQGNLATSITPGGLTATNISSEDETYGGIEVRWINPITTDATIETELYASFKPKLVLTIIQIASGGLITFNTPHELVIGDEITSKSGLRGLQNDKIYFVTETPSPYIVKISATKNGSPVSLTTGTNLNIRMLTGSIIATLPVTMNYYIDVITNSMYEEPEEPVEGEEETPLEVLERVHKWYWIRNKITQI